MRSRPALSSPGIWPKTVVAFNHAVLHFNGAAHGVDDTAKLNEDAVACPLNDAAVMQSDGRVEKIAPKSP
jgi:hypothetical protein